MKSVYAIAWCDNEIQPCNYVKEKSNKNYNEDLSFVRRFAVVVSANGGYNG